MNTYQEGKNTSEKKKTIKRHCNSLSWEMFIYWITIIYILHKFNSLDFETYNPPYSTQVKKIIDI